MRIVNGNVFDLDRGFIRRELCTDGSRISMKSGDEEIVDAAGCFVIPGLIDLHFHGCMGEDFSDADAAGLQTMAAYELRCGVTAICPAGMTLPEAQLIAMCENAANYKCTAKGGAELVGINLEGPFLSEAKKGAQNGAYLQAPDIRLLRRLQEASGGLARLVTVAPELPGAMDFIREAQKEGITVSLGHTTADYDTARTAFQAGARQATHLFNAMPAFTHRAPGVVGAAFDEEQACVELICDGVHIHESVVRAVFRLFGAERVILISDTMRAVGMPDGTYTLGGQDVTVKGNLCALPDGTIAGSATNLMSCMKTAVSFGIPLKDAVRAASWNPAGVLGVRDSMGSLEVGKKANLVLLDENDLSVRAVFFQGKPVERS